MKSNLLIKILLQLFLVFMSITPLSAALDNQGKHFVFSFIPNYQFFQHEDIRLYISSEHNTNGTVQVPGLNFSTSFTVMANEIKTIILPNATDDLSVQQISNYGVEIFSEDDIVVYALNRRNSTTDAALVLPTESLGLEYIITTYTFAQEEVAITALYSETEVTIEKINSIPFSVNLGNLNTYLLTGLDLTGTVIKSTKPISISNGNQCANVPQGTTSCDHLFEINPPVSTWGQSFFSVPLAMRKKGDLFRIVASQDDTDLFINDILVDTLQRSEFYESIITEESFINTSKPVQVSQFSVGDSYDGVMSDPFMMLVPPYEQYMNSYTFNTLDPELNIANNFINVVIKTEAIDSLLLDAKLVDSSLFQSINNSEYSGAQIPVSAGSHHIESIETFGLFVYGFGNAESYGYPGGMSFEKINPIGDKFVPNMSLQHIGQSILVRATDNEDINANGTLEGDEDLNGNGTIDKRSEDINLNGILDDGEDDNNDTILDTDSGIFSIELINSQNLQLNLEGFIPGRDSVVFEVNVIDSNLLAEGELVVSDAVGNKTTETIRILSKFNNILVQSIVSHDRIEVDFTSFSIEPTKTTTSIDRTIIEWEFESFEANETREIDFDVLLKNPQPGENRLVTYTTFVSYTDMSGEDINISLGEQHVKVIAPDANINVITNQSTYRANEDVLITSTLLNRSSVEYDLRLVMSIVDSLDNVVYEFDENDLLALSASQSLNLSELWNTKMTLAGTYYLKGIIEDNLGNIIDEDKTSFTLVSDSSITDLASLRLEPNKTIYHTTDTVFVESLVGNLSLNSVLRNATLELKAQHAENNEILFEHSINVTQMAPDTLRSIAQTIDLLNSSEGRYTLYGKVVAEDGSVLATHTVSFEVQSNLSVSFFGDVKVALSTIEPGQEQRCIYSLENFSAAKLSNQPIRQILVSLESGKSMMQDEFALTLDVNESKVYEQLIDTSRFANGEYTCILQAQKNEKWRNSRSGEWKGLASAAFTVGGTPTPVVVTVPLSNTSKILLWLLMLGIGVFYLRNYYRNTGAKK